MDWSQGATETLPWKLSASKSMLKFFILVESHSGKEYIYMVKSTAAALHPSLSLAKKQTKKEI